MSEYSKLRADIDSTIRPNGQGAITGQSLQNVILEIVNNFAVGYQFKGMATSQTEPGTPDQKVFYLGDVGEYHNFGDVSVPQGSLALFKYDTQWSAAVIEIVDVAAIETSLADRYTKEQVDSITDALAAGLSDAMSAIDDRYTKSQVDTLISNVTEAMAAGLADRYTKEQVDSLISNVTEAMAAGLSNRYTKEEVDAITVPLGERMTAVEEGLANRYTKEQSDQITDALAERLTEAESAIADRYTKQESNAITNDLNHRLEDVEQLGEISVGGGDIGIATAANIADPSAANRAKVPTVGALLDSGLTVLDLSAVFPTGGADSTDHYTLAGAIAAVPANYQKGGISIKFKDADKDGYPYVQYQLMNGTWSTDVNLWRGANASGVLNVNEMNHQATAYGTAAAARAAVPAVCRRPGLKLIYLVTSGTSSIWVEDMYIGAAVDSSSWADASNWKQVGPVSVTQNTETGKKELKIGNNIALIVDNKIDGDSDNLLSNKGVSDGLSDIYPYLFNGNSNTVRTIISKKYFNKLFINIPAYTPFIVNIIGQQGIFNNDLIGDVTAYHPDGTTTTLVSVVSAVNYRYHFTPTKDVIAISIARGSDGGSHVVTEGNITLKVTVPMLQSVMLNDYTRFTNIYRKVNNYDNVLFVGDSIVKGYTNNNVLLDDCWVNLFARAIGFGYKNVAVGGAKLDQLITQLQGESNLNDYTVIYICAGLNDKHAAYQLNSIKSSVNAICDYLQNNGYSGMVVWQTPQNDLDERTTNRLLAEEIRQTIFETAISRGHSVIDGRYLPFPATKDTDLFGIISEDNVHPTELGYAVYAKYIIDVLGKVEETIKGDDITLSKEGYYDVNKNFVQLADWECDEISLSDCDAIFVDIQFDGANAYCYVLDDNNNVIVQYNNTSLIHVISKKQYNGAAKVLLCNRASHSYKVFKIYSVWTTIHNNRQEYESEYTNVKNDISMAMQSLISKDWQLSQYMAFDNKGDLVALDGIPSNNTAISIYKAIRNVWWIKANFNRGTGMTYINAGLVLAQNQQGKTFRLLKISFSADSSADNTLIDIYSHPLTSFEEQKRLINSKASEYVGSNCDLCMAVSGNVITAYLNDKYIGYNRLLKINGKSDTMFGGILMSNESYVRNIAFGQRPPAYAHFSLDDIGTVMRDIATNAPSSIFDNEMFAFLKDMHDKYGMCITLNLFYSISADGGWNLASFPNTYKSELQVNSGWLKFAFHGGDETITYNSEENNSVAITAYNNTIAEITRFAGEASIDYMPRTTYFSGNKTLFNTLRDNGVFWGCLTADDTRVDNCGLTQNERDCINVSSDYIDFDNRLYYVRTSTRFDTQTTEQVTAMVQSDIDNNGRNRVLEYFTHAATTISVKDRASIEEALKLLVAHNIRMDFAMNNMPF